MPIVLKPEELGPELAARAKEQPLVIDRGLRSGAMRGSGHLARVARRLGKVGVSGLYASSFRTHRIPSAEAGTRGGWSIHNATPYAGIIEEGARPHKVSAEGREAIRLWVVRKLLRWSMADAEVNVEAGEEIADRIIRKIEHHGQKPTYVVRDQMPQLVKWAAREVLYEIRKAASKPARGPG